MIISFKLQFQDLLQILFMLILANLYSNLNQQVKNRVMPILLF
jgi:hypothetical protein